MPTKKKEVKSKSQKKRVKIQKEEVKKSEVSTEAPKLEMPVVDHLKVIKVIGEKGDAFHCIMEDNTTRYVEKNRF
jgi:hypothetical protein